MGIEDFRVKIVSTRQLADCVARLTECGLLAYSTAHALDGEVMMRAEGRDFIIEAEVSSYADRTSISIRFALCTAPSVDNHFIETVMCLVGDADVSTVSVDGDATIEPYSVEMAQKLRDIIEASIPARRNEWKSVFGTETRRLTPDEAIRFYLTRTGND